MGYVLPQTQEMVPVSTSWESHWLQSAGVTVSRERSRKAHVFEHLTWQRESLKGTLRSTAPFTAKLLRPQLHCSKSINLYFILEAPFAGFLNRQMRGIFQRQIVSRPHRRPSC